jgi:hypothetical protein
MNISLCSQYTYKWSTLLYSRSSTKRLDFANYTHSLPLTQYVNQMFTWPVFDANRDQLFFFLLMATLK